MSDFPREAYFDPTEPQGVQTRDWTCSAMSLAWLNRAMQIDRAQDEMSAVDLIGYPANISSQYGLMDGSGRRLAELLREDRGAAWTGWFNLHEVARLSLHNALLIGGVRWYHWVGVRGPVGGGLSIANSAPGWFGIQSVLRMEDDEVLGPWAAVVVPLVFDFPQVENWEDDAEGAEE